MLFKQPTTGGALSLPANRPIAYLCAEFAITDLLPIYAGGLGVLAGDLLQEAATHKQPIVGLGLLYRLGYFHQEVTEDGQQETPQPINPLEVPLELIKDDQGETLLVSIPLKERTVVAQIWRYPLGTNSLYLLDTDHWQNSEADRRITTRLYPSNPQERLEQEIILGIGGFRALQALSLDPALYHLNEGHSAFLGLELLRQELPSGSLSTAREKAAKRLIFTNHTLVPAGSDIFPLELIREYLRPLVVPGLELERLLELGATTTPGQFSMTMLALRLTGKKNAVSRLHAVQAKKIWPEYSLEQVTNGIHLPAWIAPEWQHLLDEYIPQWRQPGSPFPIWKPLRKVPSAQMWEVHQHLKAHMLDEVYARTGVRLEQEVLTVVWARRFASYKRPQLLFSDLEKLKNLLFHPEQHIQIIVSGKSHPNDTQGKELIEAIDQLISQELKKRAVFIDDYSLSLAKFLVSGADVWLNTPIYGQEASGTSGMKSAVNGGIQYTIPDGWANEVDWYGLGYTLPAEKADEELYTLFEKKIIPTFYNLSNQGTPEMWVAMMKESMAVIASRFSAGRMLQEYIDKLYLPSLSK